MAWVRAMRHKWTGPAAIVVAVLVVYLPSLDGAFQYDDIHSIVDNPHLRTLDHLDDFFWRADMFTADPKGAMYRPLVLVSYAVNYAFFEYDVSGFRLFNLGVHLACSLLLYGFVRRWGPAGAAPAAGLLFAVHPIAGEPVNYISSRSESLCALFALASLSLYDATRRRPDGLTYGGSVAAFACALLAKSVAVVLPLGLAIRDMVADGGRPAWRRYMPYALVALAYLAWIRHALQTALVDHPVRGIGVQALTQCKALVYYLKLLAMPLGQNVEHQFTLGAFGPTVFAALGFVASLGWCICVLWRRMRGALFWLVWPAVFLLPVLIVPLNVLVNEHRLYLPAMGWAVLMGWVLAMRVDRGVGRSALVALVLIFAVLAHQRSLVWQTPTTLWSDALAKAPLMPRPHLYMGDEYRRQGHHEEALRAYGRALSVHPAVLSGGDLLAIYNNTGATYLAMGRGAKAEEWYRRALDVDPEYTLALEALEGLEALRSNEWNEEAERRYKQAMGWLVTGQIEQSVSALLSALNHQRHPKIYQALGLAYERLGDADAAVAAYGEILTMAGIAPGLRESLTRRIDALRSGDAVLD